MSGMIQYLRELHFASVVVRLALAMLLGGCIGIGILCCMQINRISYYEQEIRRLKEKLNQK